MNVGSSPAARVRIGQWVSVLRHMWLVKSSTIFIALGLVRGVSLFAFITLMTRLLLPADYGIYSNFLYITAILSPLFFLKSDVPVARKYVSDPAQTPNYIGTIVLVCSLATLASGLVLLRSQSTIQQITGIVGFWQLLILISCWSWGLSLIVLAILQIQMRAWSIAFLRTVPAVTCELSALALVFFLRGGWREALLAYTSLSILWGIVYLYWLRKHNLIRFGIHFEYLRDFLAVSLPLIPMSMGFMLVQISAQFILTHYSGPHEVGIYAAANQFALGVWLLAMSAQQAFLPWLFNILSREEPAEDYKIVAAAIGIILILAGCTFLYTQIFHFLYPLVVGANFAGGVLLLSQLAWANFFLGVQMVMNCFLYYRKQTATSAAAVCLAAICSLVIGIWRIPHGGAVIAADVTELSAALMMAFTAIATLWNFHTTFANGVRGLLRWAKISLAR